MEISPWLGFGSPPGSMPDGVLVTRDSSFWVGRSAVGQTTCFGYDLAPRRVSQRDPHGRVTYWQYSLGGNLTRRQQMGDGATRDGYAVPRIR